MEHILLVREWRTAPYYAGIELLEQWESPDNPSVYRNVTYKQLKNHREKRINAIRCNCQCNTNDDVGERKMYAFRVSSSTGDIDWHNTNEVRSDVARLEKISRQYQAMVNKIGEPAHFAQFAGYIAKIIGAELAIYRNDNFQSMTIYSLHTLEQTILKNGRE